ncbi:MAG: Tsi3 family protein [Rhodocyclaceae bacterium]|nr:Tsi3 family protein [Rhodocyclaceae bacterium]
MTLDNALRHANGLVAGQPDGFAVSRSETGFVLTEAGDLRTPRELRISLEPADPLSGTGATRELAGRSVRHRVDELGAGSAGSEFELTLSWPCAAAYCVVHAFEQSERGTPAFEWAWSEAARVHLAE